MNSRYPKHPELALKNQFFEVYAAGATKSLNDLSKPSVTLPPPHPNTSDRFLSETFNT